MSFVQYTDWVSNITFVTKRDGLLRIGLDPKDLNQALKRGQNHIPTMEELHVSHKFAGATVFSKLDARSGNWSIQLDRNSQLYIAFKTPFVHFCFKGLFV